MLSSCGGGGTTSVFTLPQTLPGTITGSVLDANTGAPIPSVSVQSGSALATSSSDGKFTLREITPASRVVVKLSAANYAEHIVVTQVAANSTTNVSTQMVPLGATASIGVTPGGTVPVPSSSGQVVIPGGAVSGTGSVLVSVTPINTSLNPGLLPGDYSAGGGTQPLETFGAITVTVTADGANIALTAGGLITIRIPVSSRAATLPATLPLYYLEPITGHWIREGTASLGGTVPNQYYEAMVSHAGTWSVDQPYETVNTTGCVVDQQGARVTGARIFAEGIDYTGSTSTDSDNAGAFALPMKKSARAAITARSGGKTSNSLAAGPSAVDFSASGSCLVLTDKATNVTVRLTWADLPVDVDSHLLTPGGDHIYFDNKGSLSAAPWANLDVDDINSFGPEITTLRKLQVGTYTFVVNNYSATFGPGLTESRTRVELNIGGDSTIYAPPLGESTFVWWTVFTFAVDAQCHVTVTPVNTWSATPPSVPIVSGAITYCAEP